MSDTSPAEELLKQPRPDDYLPEPDYTDDQDDEPGNVLLFARGFVQPTAPRTFQEALNWLAAQSTNPSQNWTGLCQKCMRTADGCPGGFSSALEQWQGMPGEYRHVGGVPADAPIGADLFSRSHDSDSSSFRFGHIIKKARPFPNRSIGAWSTDAVRLGMVDKINPPDLYDRWGHEYLGWGYNINSRIIDVKDPKPAQDQKYVILGNAVVNLDQLLGNYRVARETAKDHNDWPDRDAIQELIDAALILRRQTKKKLDDLRHAA